MNLFSAEKPDLFGDWRDKTIITLNKNNKDDKVEITIEDFIYQQTIVPELHAIIDNGFSRFYNIPELNEIDDPINIARNFIR
jgi:hypothetical protein